MEDEGYFTKAQGKVGHFCQMLLKCPNQSETYVSHFGRPQPKREMCVRAPTNPGENPPCPNQPGTDTPMPQPMREKIAKCPNQSGIFSPEGFDTKT